MNTPTHDEVKFDYVLSVTQSIDEMRFREQAFDLWLEEYTKECIRRERERLISQAGDIAACVLDVKRTPAAQKKVEDSIIKIINGDSE
jgi:hypothetical protein